MPIIASPQPYISPSSIDAAMPFTSSVGWFGCSRTDIRPASPTVLRKRVTTRRLRAAAIRSWLRISFDTAATISGVRPGAIRSSAAPSAAGDSSQLRKSPTVRCEISANACAS